MTSLSLGYQYCNDFAYKFSNLYYNIFLGLDIMTLLTQSRRETSSKFNRIIIDLFLLNIRYFNIWFLQILVKTFLSNIFLIQHNNLI